MIKNTLFELKLKKGIIYDFKMHMVIASYVSKNRNYPVLFARVQILEELNYCYTLTVVKEYVNGTQSGYAVYWETLRNQNLIKAQHLCL